MHFCKLYHRLYIVWGDFVNYNGDQLGQTSSAFVGASIQTLRNLEADISSCNCSMDCACCLYNNALLESPDNRMVQFYTYIIFPGLVNCLFRKNFSRSASSPNSLAEPNTPRTVQRSKSTEHGALQKGSIECTVGAVCTSYLLSADKHSGSFDNSRIVPNCCHC